ncbi:MAG: cobyric acid synthase [Deltaproteobacteria bacterium]|nr:cobyric acid synthase [Deltaproteobacteria bacterium]
MKPIMVQGTSSHVGKSIIVAALCRVFRNRGFRVAPFKAQNMALNSAVTADGREIGRAQAFQAEAAGVEATSDMNPILLKPTGDSRSQVIINGKVYGSMSAAQYHGFKKEAKQFVLESFLRLADEYEVIVIEGAGSPAEVNLRDNDIANMGIAEMCDSPVLLVGDIDRGGVFASLVGTLELLTPAERDRIKGFIINKFRGDPGLLKPGLEFLENRTARPVLGVIPYFKDISLPDEDGVALEPAPKKNGSAAALTLAVIKLPRISNFTDFDPFKTEAGVELAFTDEPEGLKGADAVIIPGTKNTLEDLNWLRARGFEKALSDFMEKGGLIIGICGGFQMLGEEIKDPYGIESGLQCIKGLSFINATTTLMKEKQTFQVTAEACFNGVRYNVTGYEIHMGETTGDFAPFSNIKERNKAKTDVADGGVSGNVFGTYIHGIFDNDKFRHGLMDLLKEKKGLEGGAAGTSFASTRKNSLNSMAKIVEENLDMERILEIAGIEKTLMSQGFKLE